jgi:DNA-binding CsgD family transcriptional regulator
MHTVATRDLARAWRVVDTLAEAGGGVGRFARVGTALLPGLVPSELTTLSVCDLELGQRAVVGPVPAGIGRREREAFERHFFEHPLILAHARNPRAVTRRIADSLDARAFRATALYADYYRPIGIAHVMAVPLHSDRRRLVGFVLQRGCRAFSDAERTLLERMRPQLAALHRLALAVDTAGGRCAPQAAPVVLTRREREVLGWLGAGKTNRDIAAIVGASPRTVEKHLEHIYQKLGVETRTAAVMRVARACAVAG